MKFANVETFKTLYEQGRNRGLKTISRGKIHASHNEPLSVEMRDALGRAAGLFWISDINVLINYGRLRGDTIATNPNLLVLQSTLQALINTRKENQKQHLHQQHG